ncbi:hypothetical protein PHLCEN_2v9224 [Hermanssonia centrifuga]|uniref:Uncharacterized protein n=1 Tax=Hermanssonia centrifuga TaxID=98765 RepID=A0A2R6NRD4_9APHY|nr:hypothetical protein PHLCEN_2v9224 [Hermanssonia centrifuga]
MGAYHRILEQATTNLGKATRQFAAACANIDTRELPKEEAARGRREAVMGKTVAIGKKQKRLNLATFKYHDLGHVVPTIRCCGTTKSYSTQVGESEHKRVKKFYARTNKSRHEGQITAKEHREGLLFGIKEQDEVAKKAAAETNLGRQAPDQPKKRGRPCKDQFGLLPNKEEHLPQTSYHSHHHISDSQRSGFKITTWLAQHSDDPGLKIEQVCGQRYVHALPCIGHKAARHIVKIADSLQAFFENGSGIAARTEDAEEEIDFKDRTDVLLAVDTDLDERASEDIEGEDKDEDNKDEEEEGEEEEEDEESDSEVDEEEETDGEDSEGDERREEETDSERN